MKKSITRREVLWGAGMAMVAGGCGPSSAPSDSPAAPSLGFPLVDFHAHPGHDISIDEQVRMATDRGVKLGMPQHAGKKPTPDSEIISNDDELRAWIARLEQYPVYKGIQAEGMDWPECFSTEVVAQLDYALADALTLPEADGSRTKLWEPGVRIGDPQQWMNRYADFNVEVMTRQPIDIMANPLFLPEPISGEAEALWTEPRMRRIIDAALKYNVAIEINSRYRIPGERFLTMARDAGVKFSFGSNQHGRGVAVLDYCIEMAGKLGLTAANMFSPAPAGQKPIQIRNFG